MSLHIRRTKLSFERETLVSDVKTKFWRVFTHLVLKTKIRRLKTKFRGWPSRNLVSNHSDWSDHWPAETLFRSIPIGPHHRLPAKIMDFLRRQPPSHFGDFHPVSHDSNQPIRKSSAWGLTDWLRTWVRAWRAKVCVIPDLSNDFPFKNPQKVTPRQPYYCVNKYKG